MVTRRLARGYLEDTGPLPYSGKIEFPRWEIRVSDLFLVNNLGFCSAFWWSIAPAYSVIWCGMKVLLSFLVLKNGFNESSYVLSRMFTPHSGISKT
jgi:hypothetical protein